MDLSKYLKATDPAAPNIELVRSAPIEEYLTLLKDAGLGPSGQASKLQVIIHAQKFVISRTPEIGATAEETTLMTAATVTREKVQAWKTGLSRQKGIIAAKKREYVAQHLAPSSELRDFLTSADLQSKAQRISDSAEPSVEDHLFLRRYV